MTNIISSILPPGSLELFSLKIQSPFPWRSGVHASSAPPNFEENHLSSLNRISGMLYLIGHIDNSVSTSSVEP